MTQKVPSVRLNNGADMPVIGLGTFMVHDHDVKVALNAALECGYRHIDTAYFYQNEAAIGEVLKDWFTVGRLKRRDVFITTKLPSIGNREEDVAKFLQKSLDLLELKYVDLYLVHSPIGRKGKDDNDVRPRDEHGNDALDYDTNLEKIWKAMEAQVDAGRTKAIGVSNFNSVQLERIIKVARIKPANQQVEIHAYFLQRELRALCERHGVTVCAYCPLGAPYMKTGTKDHPELLEHPLVNQIAKDHGKTAAQILLRHLVQHGLIVIPRSTNIKRINENFQIFDFTLSASEMKRLDSLDRGTAGRMSKLNFFPGTDKHPEFPFAIPF